MDKQRLQDEMEYQYLLYLLKKMETEGILDKDECSALNEDLIEVLNPYIGKLLPY